MGLAGWRSSFPYGDRVIPHIPHPVGFDTDIGPKQMFEHRRVTSRDGFVSGQEVSEAEPSDDGAGYGADAAGDRGLPGAPLAPREGRCGPEGLGGGDPCACAERDGGRAWPDGLGPSGGDVEWAQPPV